MEIDIKEFQNENKSNYNYIYLFKYLKQKCKNEKC